MYYSSNIAESGTCGSNLHTNCVQITPKKSAENNFANLAIGETPDAGENHDGQSPEIRKQTLTFNQVSGMDTLMSKGPGQSDQVRSQLITAKHNSESVAPSIAGKNFERIEKMHPCIDVEVWRSIL